MGNVRRAEVELTVNVRPTVFVVLAMQIMQAHATEVIILCISILEPTVLSIE